MNSAELLDRIEQAAIDGDVVRALLLCQKLGSDAESTALADWARHELKGYPETDYLPEYRRVRTQLFCDGAAPGQRISGVPIPMDALPSAAQAKMAKGLPLRGSISELAERADQKQSKFAPGQMGAMLRLINATNESFVTYDVAYFGISGAVLRGVVDAVRSQVVELATQLRSSLPDGAPLDSATVNAAVSETITAPMVNITGDYNEVTLGDSGDVKVSAVSSGSSSSEPKHRVSRWLKRILEAIVAIGTVVGVLWGGAGSPLWR